MEQVSQARNVAILVYEKVEPLDFVGPFEVFISASGFGRDFQVYTVAETDDPVQAVGNLGVLPAYSFASCPKPDVLIVPGGWGSREQMLNPGVTDWVREAAAGAEIVLSVCTGALILATAGLLDGLRVTTNRSAIERLREAMPATARMVEDVRYVDNGRIVLSAGVSAGMDASLYVVSKLLGEERALKAAAIMEYEWNREKSAD